MAADLHDFARHILSLVAVPSTDAERPTMLEAIAERFPTMTVDDLEGAIGNADQIGTETRAVVAGTA